MVMTPEQFTGFMEKVTEHVRPKAILQTIKLLQEQGQTPENTEIQIHRENYRLVRYELRAYIDNKQVQITYGRDKYVHKEKTYSNVNCIEVSVIAETHCGRNDYGAVGFWTDFNDTFIIKGENKDGIYWDVKNGIIQEMKII